MRLKTLAAACLVAPLSSFTVASAESDICKEIEWWIVDAQSDPPFSSFDPELKSADTGEYEPGSAVDTLDSRPCRLRTGQRKEGGPKNGSLRCDLPIEDAGFVQWVEDAGTEYESWKSQLSACSVLKAWEASERRQGAATRSIWTHRADAHSLDLILKITDKSRPGPFGGTIGKYGLEISLSSIARTTAVSSADKPPRPTQTAIPRNQGRWGARIANAYPEIAERLGWEGTVGLTVIVDPGGRATHCSITRSSGWPILDHTACESMKAHARFEPVVDARGNPAHGRFNTQIAYVFR